MIIASLSKLIETSAAAVNLTKTIALLFGYWQLRQSPTQRASREKLALRLLRAQACTAFEAVSSGLSRSCRALRSKSWLSSATARFEQNQLRLCCFYRCHGLHRSLVYFTLSPFICWKGLGMSLPSLAASLNVGSQAMTNCLPPNTLLAIPVQHLLYITARRHLYFHVLLESSTRYIFTIIRSNIIYVTVRSYRWDNVCVLAGL